MPISIQAVDSKWLPSHYPRFGFTSLWQASYYTLALGHDCFHGAFFKHGNNLGHFSVTYRRKVGLKFGVINQGPLFILGISEADRLACLNTLRRWARPVFKAPIILSPDGLDSASGEQLKQAHFFSLKRSPERGTFIVDLTLPSDQLRKNLESKWRNQLCKAEKSGLTIHFSTENLRDQLANYEQFQKSKGFQGISSALILGLDRYHSSTEYLLTCRVYLNDIQVGGAILAIHGQSATYLVGWQEEAYKSYNIGNFYLWESVMLLKEKGLCFFDLGGYNTIKTPSIAKFKAGLGGQKHSSLGYFI